MDESRLKLLVEEAVRAALEPEYMNNEQAARFLGIVPRTLIHWRYAGRISFHWLGSCIVYSVADLREHLKCRRVEAKELNGLSGIKEPSLNRTAV